MIFLSIVFVQVGGFDIGRRAGIGIVQETANINQHLPASDIYFLHIPLNASEDGRHVIGRAPSVL